MNATCREYRTRTIPLAIAALFVLCGLSADAAAAPASVTLLVHGIKVDLSAGLQVWGEPVKNADGRAAWTGLIGQLERAGHRYGGVIRPRGATLALPGSLDTAHTQGDPRLANLFALEFSAGANVDGLAYKTLELAACLTELRRFTGCAKVNLVAHSAGGLVARAYLQSALPGIAYRGDVDRLITISTPHLGSVLAEHLGDFLGTRATALQPGGELIRRLNEELELPPDVFMASIVVRGVGTRVAALDLSSKEYDSHLDREVLAKLPQDYRHGGDQVVDVRSQNLRLARAASRYEAATGRPILYLLARVADPSPRDRSLLDRTVHEAAPGDPWVGLWLEMLLDRNRHGWAELPAPLFSRWIELQASLSAYGVIEEHTAQRHAFSEVTAAKVQRLSLVEQRGNLRQFYFAGSGISHPKLLPTKTQSTAVAGLLELAFDRFGRIVSQRHALAPAAR